MSRADRKYDIILWGATGFTGGLVAQYLAGATKRSTQQGLPPLKWAIAGRSASKLEKVKAKIDSEKSIATEPGLIVADASDQQSMQKMTAQARVMISTVGPFVLHGEPLIAACVKTGTDYVDSTGEASFVAQMIQKYQKKAEETGALLVSMCGFDSIPSDLGAFLVASELKTKYKTNTLHIQGYIVANGVSASGGTVASIIAGLDQPKEQRRQGPYVLNPPNSAPVMKRKLEKDQLIPKYDETLQRWTTPWLMALVNTRVVRRTLALRRELERARGMGNGFGDEVSYNETMPTPTVVHAFIRWFFLVVGMLLIVIKPTRRILQKFVLPLQGEGPSEEARAKCTFTMRCIGQGENGKRVQSIISGGDPGYTDTAIMVGESALLLAFDRQHLELNDLVAGKAPFDLIGGFFTPALAGGHRLAERLRGGGMGVVVEEYNGSK